MKQLLTQNEKMRKSSQNEATTLVAWTLPAFQSETGFKTCPMAKDCVSGCYARSGTYRFNASVLAHNNKLLLSQSNDFVPSMISEINSRLDKRSVFNLKIRIHDAGDFYSLEYLEKWVAIMNHFISNDRVTFYAYTKMVSMFKDYNKLLPNNFTVIYSYGGLQDNLINPDIDRHSKVFESHETLTKLGYVDGSLDDMVAAIGPSNKIGLVYHGAKNYNNTTWNKVT